MRDVTTHLAATRGTRRPIAVAVSDNGAMAGAITITLLAVLCAAAVFVMLFVTRRPAEGWSGTLREAVVAWRGRELSWVDGDADDVDSEVGGLGALYQMSEPGSGYAITPVGLDGFVGTGVRTRGHASAPSSAPAASPVASHAQG